MTFEFTEQDLQVLDKAIQQLPYYLAAPLLKKINQQIQDASPQEYTAPPAE